MESVLLTSSSCSKTNLIVSFRARNVLIADGLSSKSNLDTTHFVFSYAHSFSSSHKLKSSSSSVIVAASKKDKNNKKVDTHSFVVKPDESAGLFPEAVLLKEVSVMLMYVCVCMYVYITYMVAENWYWLCYFIFLNFENLKNF